LPAPTSRDKPNSTNPLWASTNACTTIAKGKAKEFCDAVATLRTEQTKAAAVLNRIAPFDANPEVTGLAANTGIAAERVQFLIAVVPAVLVELLASVGFYAICRRPSEKAPKTLLGARLRSWLPGTWSSRKKRFCGFPGGFWRGAQGQAGGASRTSGRYADCDVALAPVNPQQRFCEAFTRYKRLYIYFTLN
jgi:hypothetical protein